MIEYQAFTLGENQIVCKDVTPEGIERTKQLENIKVGDYVKWNMKRCVYGFYGIFGRGHVIDITERHVFIHVLIFNSCHIFRGFRRYSLGELELKICDNHEAEVPIPNICVNKYEKFGIKKIDEYIYLIDGEQTCSFVDSGDHYDYFVRCDTYGNPFQVELFAQENRPDDFINFKERERLLTSVHPLFIKKI